MPPLVDTAAVLLPGSGSDSDFALRAFAPVVARCSRTVAVDPAPPSVVAAYRAALDVAAHTGPLIVCGVSLGSAVAAQWALDNAEADATLLLTLPPWSGTPGATTPAALAARITADTVAEVGLRGAIDRMRAGSPPWLANELARSWAGHGDFLAPALAEAAAYAAPTERALRAVRARTVIVGARGDAVHPVSVAEAWGAAIPGAQTRIVDLDAVGSDPATLGRAGLDGLERLAAQCR